MSLAILPLLVLTREVPANSKAAMFHNMPKQSELCEVANSSDVPQLRRASNHTTGDTTKSSDVIG